MLSISRWLAPAVLIVFSPARPALAATPHPGLAETSRTPWSDAANLDALERAAGPAPDELLAALATPGGAPSREMKEERSRRALALASPAKAAKTVTVDCAKGKSLQAAIDANTDTLVIEVRGICHENLRIDRKQVTLHGLDPLTDGVRGVVAIDQPAVIEIRYSSLSRIENLSVSEGPASGVAARYSNVALVNCRIEGNGGSGLLATLGSFVSAVGLTIVDNGVSGVIAQYGATVFCDAGVLSGNASWAGRASRNGLLSVRDCVVLGERGLLSVDNSYADVDCVSAATGHPCSLASNRAVLATSGATAALYGVGEFSGQLVAAARGNVDLSAARQTATGTTPSGAPLVNQVEGFSTLLAEPLDEPPASGESGLVGTTLVTYFSRAVLSAETSVDGTVTCSRAGDAWADPGVVLTPGSTISDCQHAPPPGP